MHLPALLSAVGAGRRTFNDWEAGIHALVVVIVVIAATTLRALHDLDGITVGNIYAGAIGYAAGRSGVQGRIRTADLAASRDDRTGP